MSLKKKIKKISGIICTAFVLCSCTENEFIQDYSNNDVLLKVEVDDFGAKKQFSLLFGNNPTPKLDAYIFKDGILTESHEDLTGNNGIYNLALTQKNGTLYILGNTTGARITEAEIQTEETFKKLTLASSENPLPMFFTGQVALSGQTGNTVPLTVKRGLARIDFRTKVSSGDILVTDFIIKNASQETFILPQPTIQTPEGAEKKDVVLQFDKGLEHDSTGILYLYEQYNPDLKVYLRAEIDGRVYELEQSMPQELKRNNIYTITVRKDLASIGLDIEEWNTGESTELIPSIDSPLKVDPVLSQIPSDVHVTDEGSTIIFPHTATELLLAIDCNDELEVIAPNSYPLVVEPVAQTRGLEGKNLFSIRKPLYAPGMPSEETILLFHRKGLENSYPEDCIRLVLQANPAILEGLMKFDSETYSHHFDHYIDNELGTFTLPEEKELIVEFDSHEDPWLKVELQEGTDNVYRVIAGWKPNDPTANGRIQEGKLVIRNKADVSAREEYRVSRRNYGLPVTWLHGVWWCKYNARGNSKVFEDQILSSDDPAVQAGMSVFDYLTRCSANEYYDLWGWAYQGDSGKGMQVTVVNGKAVLDGFRNDANVHMNKLAPTALAPQGYEVPSMEEFNRMFNATDYVWVMWNGTHTLKEPWEGHTKIQREQRRRNDLVVDSLAIKDLIYVAMKSPDFPQFEPVVWYGPASQWNAEGIYHGHYNNILFTVYSPQGSGWYFGGGMSNLYLTQNGAGTKDTRILRFKKSPVEYIYGTE